MPPVPHGANGRWEWDGRSRARQIDLNGQEWFLKGRWKWVEKRVAEDRSLRNASISQIIIHHKPAKILRKDFRIEKFLNTFIFVTAGILVVSVLTLLIIL